MFSSGSGRPEVDSGILSGSRRRSRISNISSPDVELELLSVLRISDICRPFEVVVLSVVVVNFLRVSEKRLSTGCMEPRTDRYVFRISFKPSPAIYMLMNEGLTLR